MKTWKALWARIFHWKTLPALAALGNIGFGVMMTYEGIDDFLKDKQGPVWYDEAGAGFFCLLVFLNLFTLIHVFLPNKVAVNIFLTSIFGFDAVVWGFMGFIMIWASASLKAESKSTLLAWALLILVASLSFYSAFLFLWKLESPQRARQGSQ